MDRHPRRPAETREGGRNVATVWSPRRCRAVRTAPRCAACPSPGRARTQRALAAGDRAERALARRGDLDEGHLLVGAALHVVGELRCVPRPLTRAVTRAGPGSSDSVTFVISGEPGSRSILYVPGLGSKSPTIVLLSSSEVSTRSAGVSAGVRPRGAVEHLAVRRGDPHARCLRGAVEPDRATRVARLDRHCEAGLPRWPAPRRPCRRRPRGRRTPTSGNP